MRGPSLHPGMRVRVSDVLDLLAAGLTGPEILQELPYVEQEDLQACLQYAAREIDRVIWATCRTA